MKIVFLYAGQGSQKPGMGKDLYDAFPAYRQWLDAAPADFDLLGISFDGPERELVKTRHTQPALLAMEMGITDLLRRCGVIPQGAAGLSLGEYAALYAAGAFSKEEAMQLIALRAGAMEKASENIEAGMTAVLGIDRQSLQAVCEAAAGETGKLVQIANYNCPGQLVIAGEKAAVERAAALAQQSGAKRCIPLSVSGPFHTSLMATAGAALEKAFQAIEIAPLQMPVYFNATAKPLQPGEKVSDLLVRQVQTSVYMEDTLQRLCADGFDTAVEIGPGKTLSGFVRKTCPDMKTYNVETAADVQTLCAALGGQNDG